MNPGAKRQRLVFYLEDGVDEQGYPIFEPVVYTKAWGELQTLKGSTFYAAAQTNMEHNRNFKIRYQRKLDDGNRPKGLKVKWKGIEHEIESIENIDGLNKEMLIRCKAVS